MIWYGIFFFLILFFVVVQQNYTVKFRLTTPVVFIFAFILVILAVIRPTTLPDYSVYLSFYECSNKAYESFEFFAHLIKSISPSWFIFLFFFAFISISLKLFAIKLNSEKQIFSIVTYISTSLVLHDFIQIRVSCAIGIIWVALYYLNDEKYIKYFILISLATLFHVSAAIFFPIWFLRSKNFKRFFWVGLLIISYLLAITNIDLIQYALLFLGDFGHIGNKLTTYYELAQANVLTAGTVNIFSIYQILKLFFVIICFIKIDKLNDIEKLLLKIYTLGCCCLPLFHNVAAIAMRFAELLTSVVVFLLPALLSFFKNRIVSYVLFLFYLMAFYFLNVIYPNYFL